MTENPQFDEPRPDETTVAPPLRSPESAEPPHDIADYSHEMFPERG